MGYIFCKIKGRVSNNTKSKIFTGSTVPQTQENNILIFIDYSYFNIPIGFKFEYLIQISNDIRVFPIDGELKFVTQQWGRPFLNGIPEGHKTICNIQFDTKSMLLIISEILIADYWKEFNSIYLLSNVNNGNWNKYYGIPSAKPFNH